MTLKFSACFTTKGNRGVIPHHSDFNFTNQLTFEMWLWVPTKPTVNFPVLFCKGNVNTAYNPLFDAANKIFTGRLRIGGVSYDVSEVIDDDRWVHVAITYNGSVIKLYFDGVEVDSTSASGNLDTNSGSLRLGGSEVIDQNIWEGLVSDLRFWNIARAGATIAAEKDQRLNGDESGLVGYWKLDDGPGLTAVSLVDAPDKNCGMTSGACWSPRDPF